MLRTDACTKTISIKALCIHFSHKTIGFQRKKTFEFVFTMPGFCSKPGIVKKSFKKEKALLGSDHQYVTWISSKARASVSNDPRLPESFSGNEIHPQHQTSPQRRRKGQDVHKTTKQGGVKIIPKQKLCCYHHGREQSVGNSALLSLQPCSYYYWKCALYNGRCMDAERQKESESSLCLENWRTWVEMEKASGRNWLGVVIVTFNKLWIKRLFKVSHLTCI